MTEHLPETVFIGDDFTGASDTLAAFARGGRRTRLFLSVPGAADCEGLDAVGIATALRAMEADAIRRACEAMAPQIRDLGARFYHFKVCSTFDSSETVGSIGAAVRGLSEALQPALTIILGGQPSLGRYCLFGNLFARAPDGIVYRIDRHPVMSSHPVTPMGEADLRRHLQRQGLADISLVSGAELDVAPAIICPRLLSASGNGLRPVLVDAASQAHVDTVGAALAGIDWEGPILLVGPSSVAEAICAARPALDRKTGASAGATRQTADADRPVLLFAGSRSSLTAAQIAHAARYSTLAVTPVMLENESRLDTLAATARGHLGEGRNVLLHLQHEARYGLSGEALALKCAALMKTVVAGKTLSGIGVAGGDTSSLILSELQISSLSHVADLDRGVALCEGRMEEGGRSPVLLLKGGQMGDATLFDRFAAFCRN
ncbi:four-carbon acid sugar kinase family protein [Rhizobium halophytocola]|uniref:Uncharacterized protein YgbK (DUF1537 family) n=1 Tax=Rhizobium halophytocola TaxID=735519 RepID=A0ABS4DUF4_9HYPH|nr:four-carbon acid sugar kinase family protein [Rhizobium halophytocola]MBP1849317.1 uncharacterized protein YgbK (DUF1537 family) [Rhizobium halophytocola]